MPITPLLHSAMMMNIYQETVLSILNTLSDGLNDCGSALEGELGISSSGSTAINLGDLTTMQRYLDTPDARLEFRVTVKAGQDAAHAVTSFVIPGGMDTPFWGGLRSNQLLIFLATLQKSLLQKQILALTTDILNTPE